MQIGETLTNLNTIIFNKINEDDCDIYAKLLANKLRRYDGYERLKIMYEIDGLLLRNPPSSMEYSESSSIPPVPKIEPTTSEEIIVPEYSPYHSD